MERNEMNKRRSGDQSAVIAGLKSENPIHRFQAICGAVNHDVRNKDVIHLIENLTNDSEIVLGYKVGILAVAAIDRLSVSKYQGDDPRIKALIDAPVWFDEVCL